MKASSASGEAMEATTTSTRKYGLGMRHVQAALVFLAQMIGATQRVIMNVAIVAMVDQEKANPNYPEFAWNLLTQTVILSSFNYGHLFLQVPSGLLADRFGPTILLAVTMLISSVFTMFTPQAAAYGGGGLVFAFRFIEGLVQGALNPATNVLMAKWVPVEERGKCITIVFGGTQVGFVIALASGGVMMTGSGGWPSVFYLFGGLGVAWTVLWLLLAADSPAQDKYISDAERAYIQDSLRTNPDTSAKRLATPWRAILTSGPVWALIAANCGYAWGFLTVLTELPTYMNDVLGFDLQSNGLLSALPYLVMFVASIVFSIWSDVLNNSKIISVTQSRKIFNTVGFWGPALAFIVLAYASTAALSVALIVLAVGVNAAAFLGFQVNYMDLAPNFVGTVMGLANTAGNVVGCFGPMLVGTVVTEAGSADQWRIVFFATAAIFFFTGLFYARFASGELQQWNEPLPLQDQHNAETDSLIATPSTSSADSNEHLTDTNTNGYGSIDNTG